MATAPPTRESFEEAALFIEQVQALVKEHLAEEEGSYLFSHFTQARGFLVMAMALFKLHGGSKDGFNRFVSDTWRDVEKRVTIEEQPPIER